jgi:hypothetical protein
MILLAALALLQQSQLRGYALLHRPAVPDTIGAFWSVVPGIKESTNSPAFRQLGAFSAPDRIVINPCGDSRQVNTYTAYTMAKWLTDSLRQGPLNAAQWFRVGCARSLLNWPLGRQLDREEYLLADDGPWSAGAIAAFLHVLELLPNDSEALVAVSRETLRGATGRLAPPGSLVGRRLDSYAFGVTSLAGDSFARPSVGSVAEVLYRAVRDGHVPVEVARACTSMMIDIADFSSAHECSTRALRAGSDTTWHALRLAWLAYLRGDTSGGQRWFRRAAAAAHDRPSRIELGWHFEPEHDWRDSYAMRAAPHLPSGVSDPFAGAEIPDIRAEREGWLALPDSVFDRWIRDRLANHGARGAWLSFNRKALARHFGSITTNGSAFRACVSERDSMPPCADGVAHTDFGVVHLGARRYQLWNPANGEPMTLFVYSASPDDLAVSEVNGRRVIEAEVRLDQDSAGKTAQDTTILLQQPVVGGTTELVAGQVLAYMSRTSTAWSFAFRQPHSSMRGGAYDEDQPPITAGPLAISDLVLGSPDRNGIPWTFGADKHYAAYPSAPTNLKAAVQLYYQVHSDRARTDVTTTFLVFRTGVTRPSITVAAPTPLRAGINESEQRLDLSRLNKGRYRIEMRVNDRRGVVDTRSIELELVAKK